MTPTFNTLSLFLFVPADEPERISKAAASDAEAIMIDLWDAVAPARKVAARNGLPAALAWLSSTPAQIFVRVNAIGTRWDNDDVEALSRLSISGAVLPKVEWSIGVEMVRRRLAGFRLTRLAADLGCVHDRDALLFARSRIVLAARLAGKPAPIDGVTPAMRDDSEISADARYGISLGFGGKLLVDPAQIGAARTGTSQMRQMHRE